MPQDIFFAKTLGLWVCVDIAHGNLRTIRFIEDHNGKPRITLPITSELERYFRGENVDFSSCHVELSHLTPFQQQVLTVLRSVPWGSCITYSELAAMIGRPGAARAVGNALGRNMVPVVIPCHRVVAKHGIGGFSLGTELKRKLLRLESVDV